jgi:hypothetical protein
MSPTGIGKATRVSLVDVQGPGVHPDRHDPEGEPDVAHPVHEERLLARQGRRVLAEPEADQEVAAEAHQLPGDEDRQPAVAEDEQQHREHEQVEVGEESPVARRIVGHVADRVDVDQQADRRDDDEQHGRQVVDDKGRLDVEAARRDPVPQLHRVAAIGEAAGEGGHDDDHRDRPRRSDGEHRDPERPPAQAPPDGSGDHEPGEGQGRDERDEGVHAHRRIASYSSTSGVLRFR